MAGKSRFSPETLAAIAADYAAGDRSGAVAVKWGVDKKTVTEVVRRLGGNVRTKSEDTGRNCNPLSPEEITAIKEMRDGGRSQQAIGRALGRSQSFVGRALDGMGYARLALRTGPRHGSWKGGITSNDDGYLLQNVPSDDPLAGMRNSTGYVLQHRLVMARYLNRALFRHETVHHVNGDKTDNRIENLQLRIGGHGAGIAMECGCCGSINIVPAKLSEVD